MYEMDSSKEIHADDVFSQKTFIKKQRKTICDSIASGASSLHVLLLTAFRPRTYLLSSGSPFLQFKLYKRRVPCFAPDKGYR
ncbi:hypothetical protein M513_03891 [Trichuris suis]|uniref:Uncharacterized protein n=2 Tax=Trichuris suis TaxID=68888 RepID=A0A085MDF4_9BILA|nr:hypothetical protein M513_03891 [Trichuris suis]